VFIELSNKLAGATTTQQMLYFTFADTNGKKPEEISLPMRSAPDIYKIYSVARTELRQNISVYARRAEIFIDWPSDLGRNPALEKHLPSDPITKSGINTTIDHDGAADVINLIGAYNFDCDLMYPESRDLGHLGDLTLPRPPSLPKNPNAPPQIVVNWGSLKHQLVTFQYCFERIHDKLKPTREWASSIGTAGQTKPNYNDNELIRDRLDGQVARFNYFLALAMRRIEEIRIRYRPSGFWCYVPGIREITDVLKKQNIITQGCSPIHYAESDAEAQS
jgi:hypothetical protein